ncbi:MAG: TIM barrel protein [Clostridia bacterium]|nr:TIM barrel protein [Clostridia bacterium]
MKYSACIDMMFAYTDFYERFSEVKKCGIDAVEFWKWSNKDLDRVCDEMQKNALDLSIFNIDCRDENLSYDLSRGVLNSGRCEELISAFGESVDVYRKLGAHGMIVLIGETRDDISVEKQNENILKCLNAVKPYAEKENINLFVEPLNATDRKNYFMPYSRPLFDILEQVDSPNIKMLFDIYHQQMTEGHICESIDAQISRIGHFHVADCPGRHEPGTGELNYPNIISHISTLAYEGYVGLEYRATKNDPLTLGFLSEVQR